MPRHLQSRGFDLQRGVEQEPGAAKKHLNTREFKQQQEALHSLEIEAEAVSVSLEQRQQEESALLERLQSYERQAQEAEKILSEQTEIPQASMFSYKTALETAQEIIERQKKALAAKGIVTAQNEKQQAEIQSLRETVTVLNTKIGHLKNEMEEDQKRSGTSIMQLSNSNQNLLARLEETEKFFRWNPEADKMHRDYMQGQRQEAQRKAAEQKRLAQEREQQERQRQEEQQRREAELAREKEVQQLEREREREREQRPRGMGMGR